MRDPPLSKELGIKVLDPLQVIESPGVVAPQEVIQWLGKGAEEMRANSIVVLFLLFVILIMMVLHYAGEENWDRFFQGLSTFFKLAVKAFGAVFEMVITLAQAMMKVASQLELTPTPVPGTPTATPVPGTPTLTPTVIVSPTPGSAVQAERLSRADFLKCTIGAGALTLFFACLLGLSQIFTSISRFLC